MIPCQWRCLWVPVGCSRHRPKVTDAETQFVLDGYHWFPGLHQGLSASQPTEMWQTIWYVRCLQKLMCWSAWTPVDGTILKGHGNSEYWANWQRAIQVSFDGSSVFLVRDFLLLILWRYRKSCPNLLPLSSSTNTLHAMMNCIPWTVF